MSPRNDAAVAFLAGGLVHSAELPPPGFRPESPAVHALVHARVFCKPGTVFSNATVVLRDGFIMAVGPEVQPPSDARVWDFSGFTIYPGFLDAYLTLGATNLPLHVGWGDKQRTARANAADLGSGVGAGAPRFFGVAGQEADPGSPALDMVWRR